MIWVVKSGGRYYQFMGGGRVYYTDDIQNANRFENERMAVYMAGRLGGRAIPCKVVMGQVIEADSAG